MPRTALLAARLAALLALVLAGCSLANRPLVRVGSQKVTTADYERAARGAMAQYSGLPDAAKAQLVSDLTRRAMMLEMAHQLGHETSPVVLNSDRANERRELVQALFAYLASSAQRVSEAEARALYDARNQEAEVSMLYTSSREAALAAKARLEGGEPFEKVAQSLSLPGMLPPDGNMGTILPGSLPDPLDGAVRHQPVGTIGGPFEEREGWFLVKITKRQAHAQAPWDALRAGMFDLERQRKQRAAFNHAYQDLKAEWHMELAPGGSQVLFRVASPVEPVKPTPEQRRMPLATYDGGIYTLQDALDDLQDASIQRPPGQVLPAMEIWIEGQTMTRIAMLEARRRHLNEEPDLAASLRRKHEDLLLEGVYQTAVAGLPPPSPELVRRTWEQMKGNFARLAQVKVTSVVVADTAMAAKLVRQGQQTRSLAEAAKLVDPSLEVRDTTVDYPTTSVAWNTMLAMFTRMQPGAWFGPEALAHGWRVIQMVDKTMVQQSFEELAPAMQQNIASSASELARDARFQQFTDSLTQVYKPVVDHALLAKLPWPVKAAGDAGP